MAPERIRSRSSFTVLWEYVMNFCLIFMEQAYDAMNDTEWGTSSSFGYRRALLYIHKNIRRLDYHDITTLDPRLILREARITIWDQYESRPVSCTNYFLDAIGSTELYRSSQEWRGGATPTTECDSDARDGLGSTLPENRTNKETEVCAVNDN